MQPKALTSTSNPFHPRMTNSGGTTKLRNLQHLRVTQQVGRKIPTPLIIRTKSIWVKFGPGGGVDLLSDSGRLGPEIGDSSKGFVFYFFTQSLKFADSASGSGLRWVCSSSFGSELLPRRYFKPLEAVRNIRLSATKTWPPKVISS